MGDQKEYNRKLIEDFRASRSASEDPFAGRPLLLLTTTGAKSGQRRTTPLMYVPDGDRLLIIASNAGAPKQRRLPQPFPPRRAPQASSARTRWMNGSIATGCRARTSAITWPKPARCHRAP